MSSSYIAYVDESGCEGWDFDSEPGSSHWFVISAVLVAIPNIEATLAAIDEARPAFNGKVKPFHFTDLSHGGQAKLLRFILNKDFHTVTVGFRKTHMQPERFRRDPDNPDDKSYRLYFYAVKFLLEKICWSLEKAPRHNGDGTVEIVFSERTMNYHDLKRYLIRLKSQKLTRRQCSIDWNIVDPLKMTSRPHKECNGLQIVDAVATSYRFAVDVEHRNHTRRHAESLREKAFCNSQGRILGSGFKVFPTECEIEIYNNDDYGWLRG